MRIRADVLACAPGAVAATKTLIRQLPTLPDEQKMRVAAENFTACLKGDEGDGRRCVFPGKAQAEMAAGEPIMSAILKVF